MLRKHGMRTVQIIGLPQELVPIDADAIVIALKSRMLPLDEAAVKLGCDCQGAQRKNLTDQVRK
jgi:uncharacterized protein YgbK (DUF1537 family)